MPITTKHGSIFDSAAEVIVIPVNCVGVMGKGLALEAKKRFKGMFAFYEHACKTCVLIPGGVYQVGRVVCLATKDHWRNPARLEWVESGLIRIRKEVKTNSIALPQLGCGCGGLNWADVEPLVHKHLGGLECVVEVWIYD